MSKIAVTKTWKLYYHDYMRRRTRGSLSIKKFKNVIMKIEKQKAKLYFWTFNLFSMLSLVP